MVTKKEIEKGYSQYEELQLAKEKLVKELAKFWIPFARSIIEVIAKIKIKKGEL